MAKTIVDAVPKNLLFRFAMPCQKTTKKWSQKFELDSSYAIASMGHFEQQMSFAEVRGAWNEAGMFFTAVVTGKKQSLWCRPTQLLESDGFQIWIDTRDTHNVHRATKFCHWFLMMPSGGGAGKDKPHASMLKINRSKDDPSSFNREKIEIRSKTTKDGYILSTHIPAACLSGWNTEDHRRIGFNYAVVDRELGWQTLAVGPEMPIAEDPSLWQSLNLIG